MSEQTYENLDSENEELEEELEEEQDSDDDSEDLLRLKEKNRQLFARAKKAEGFIQKDGEWVKKPTVEKPKTESKTQDVSEVVRKQLEEDRLEQLDYPDDLKPEIKKLAELQGVSVRKAAQDPYILHRKEVLEKEARLEDGSVTGTKKGTPLTDISKPPKVDLTTEDGRKEMAEWRRQVKEQAE